MSQLRGIAVTCLVGLLKAQPSQSPTSTPSPTASIGSTPTPSSTPLPRAYGTVRELAVLDCNGGLHILPGHPLETNFNLRGVKNAFNIFASETSDHARCAAGKAGCTLTDAEVERHFIPSVPMILNYYEKPFNKLTLPSGCMRTDVQNGQTPAFGQTFWDQSAWSTVLLPFFLNKSTTLPEYINWPDTCNLATYAAGLGCKITVDEPVSGTIFQVGVDRCPRSFLPYISITCRGKWCENFMRPCEINTNAPQCGDGLVCRTTEDDTGRNGENPGDQLLLNLTEWGFLGNLASEVNMLLSTPQEPTCPGLNSPGGGTVRQQMYLRLRNQLMSWWNVSIPPTFNLRPSPDLAFCLPPDATQKAIQNQWDAVWDTGFDVDLSQDADVVSCLNGALDSSCDLEKIGDGQCDVGCYIAACKWDGGDCGGPPLDQTLPVTFNPDRRATNFSDSCLVQPLTSTDPLYDFRTRINYWEPCNGAPSRCEGVGNQFTCQCWCNLNANDRFIPADLPGSQCQNCKPPPLCEDRAACAAKYKARGLLGFTNRIDSWDGILDSGLSVFDWDRKTGLNYSTPMGFFDISRGVNPGSRPLLQTTCSGEVAITLVNGWLQAGAHMPLMQEAVSFVTGVNRDLQVCRNHFIQVARGTPPQNVVPLSQQQMDVRFMPHTLAHWMYQYMTLGQNENAWNQNTMWQYVDANGPGGAGAGAQQKITNAFWFGIFEMNDTLVVKEGNRREPSPTPTPSQGAPAATAFLLSNLPYADEWRMLPPRQGSCDIQSALDYRDQNNEADASRRCNFKWNALGFLFPRSDTDWNLPSFHELWIDIQHDSCQNAPTGRQPPVFFSPPPGVAATPLPMPTMDRLMAKRAMPQVNVWYAGDAVPWMSSPKACVLDSDCGSYGGNARCADLDLDFLNISDYFGINSRNVDPFGFLPFGRYNANQGSGGCSGGPASVTGQSAFRRSMRNVLLALAGRPPTALGAPKFCMMFPRKYKLDYGIWEDTAAFRPNTCGLGPLAATPSPSIRATATSSPLGSPTPAYKCVLQSALPTAPSHVPNYRPVQMLNVDRYDDSLAVGFDMLGVSPLRLPVSSARTLSTSYGSQGVIMPDSGGDYVISLPGWRAAQITNKHADRFRYALATAYTRFGVPIPPDSIFIMRVGEYAAGISVFFRVDLPDRAWRGNLTDQMFSGRPGTLSQPGIPGSVMAEMGVAPTFRQGEVVFAEIFPPPRGLTAGEIFGIILLVTVILVPVYAAIMTFGLKRQPFPCMDTRVSVKGVPMYLPGSCASRIPGAVVGKKDAKVVHSGKKSLGGIVENVAAGKTKDDTKVTVATNPLQQLPAAAVAAATAASSASVSAPAITVVDAAAAKSDVHPPAAVVAAPAPASAAAGAAAPAPAPASVAVPVVANGTVAANAMSGRVSVMQVAAPAAQPLPVPAAPTAPAAADAALAVPVPAVVPAATEAPPSTAQPAAAAPASLASHHAPPPPSAAVPTPVVEAGLPAAVPAAPADVAVPVVPVVPHTTEHVPQVAQEAEEAPFKAEPISVRHE